MRRFRSLFIDKADIRAPGLTVLTLALHRHLPERAAIGPHDHRWCQALLYLHGQGWQTIAEEKVRVNPGTLVLLPSGIAHAFDRAGSRAPLCLAIDFRLQTSRDKSPSVVSLHRSELLQMRQHLAHLIRLQTGADRTLRCESAAVVLQMLTALLLSAGWLGRDPAARLRRQSSPILHLLGRMELDGPLGKIVAQSGYQRDYLNSLVKRETGLTLGQYRAQLRLARSKDLLSAGIRIDSVAPAVGLDDQSYFTRWFRRQTGQTPSAWSRGAMAETVRLAQANAKSGRVPLPGS
jgi:AraC family L-rhamnose operon transcriptional activator RhaR